MNIVGASDKCPRDQYIEEATGRCESCAALCAIDGRQDACYQLCLSNGYVLITQSNIDGNTLCSWLCIIGWVISAILFSLIIVGIVVFRPWRPKSAKRPDFPVTLNTCGTEAIVQVKFTRRANSTDDMTSRRFVKMNSEAKMEDNAVSMTQGPTSAEQRKQENARNSMIPLMPKDNNAMNTQAPTSSKSSKSVSSLPGEAATNVSLDLQSSGPKVNDDVSQLLLDNLSTGGVFTTEIIRGYERLELKVDSFPYVKGCGIARHRLEVLVEDDKIRDEQAIKKKVTNVTKLPEKAIKIIKDIPDTQQV